VIFLVMREVWHDVPIELWQDARRGAEAEGKSNVIDFFTRKPRD
jgi:hypothetical protein